MGWARAQRHKHWQSIGGLISSRLTLRDTWKTLQFHRGKHQGHLPPKAQSDKKSNLEVRGDGKARVQGWNPIVQQTGSRPSFCFLPCLFTPRYCVLSVQLRAVASTRAWREWSCLRVTLATTAAHEPACTLWSCPRITVSQRRAECYCHLAVLSWLILNCACLCLFVRGTLHQSLRCNYSIVYKVPLLGSNCAQVPL